VAGLRALIKKEPNALINLCHKYDLDMLCLQETKLQEMHLDDPKLKLRGLMVEHGYEEYWNCSTAKKGYSGTAVFIKQRRPKNNDQDHDNDNSHKETNSKQTKIASFFAPVSTTDDGNHPSIDHKNANLPVGMNPEQLRCTAVTYKLGQDIDKEGRSITVEFPWATIVNVYVPNSGQKLERLDFRTQEWDQFFLQYVQTKETERGVPSMWLGDLNVAHQAYDVWNNGARHLDKQAGVTPQERTSFTGQLQAGYIDAFRYLHPYARGHYSYWSQRAANRQPNKGLRLDYFVCSSKMVQEDSKVIVRDSYMIPDQIGSDHCPVVLELEIQP
jgi:exodeoxyribonuclease III